MIKEYCLKVREEDFPELVTLGKLLGIIREVTEDGITTIAGINACDWDLVFGDGKLYQDGQIIADENGNPYIHINILTRFDLRERAVSLATQYPEIAEALGNLGKFFILDDAGEPRRPKNPQCTFGY